MTARGRISLLILCLASAALCTALGFWQMGRLMDRRAANAAALAGRSLPEIDLNTVEDGALVRTSGSGPVAPERLVRARGRYDHANTVLLRGRLERDAPGVHVVVPLLLEGRQAAILVNRGFAPAADATRPDPAQLNRTDSVSIRGVAQRIPQDPDGGSPLTRGDATSWRRLDLSTLRARLPYPILDVYVHLTEAEERQVATPAYPTPATLPPLNDGPHLNYMFQWFMLAGASIAFGVLFVLRGGRRDVAP